MNRNIQLIYGDWRIIGRDPMLMISMIAPVLITLIALLGFPLISGITKEMANFSLESYFPVGNLFLFSLIPMLFGMVYGFILLDERDGGIISYLAITPLGKGGYMLIRMIMPVILSIIMCIIYLELTGFHKILTTLQISLISLIVSLEAPMILLFLGAFAGNKVEGIALSKGIGIFMIPIIADYFLTGGWRWIMSVSPLWWIERAVFSFSVERWLYLAGAVAVHILFLILLFRKFQRRMG